MLEAEHSAVHASAVVAEGEGLGACLAPETRGVIHIFVLRVGVGRGICLEPYTIFVVWWGGARDTFRTVHH